MRKAVLLVSFLAMLTSITPVKQAHANSCIINNGGPWWNSTTVTTRQAIYLNATFYELFIKKILYEGYIVGEWWSGAIQPAIMGMVGAIGATEAYLTGVYGGMIDAQVSIGAQRQLQILQADAVRDYTPSENLCRFGTNIRTLAAADQNAMVNRVAMSKMAEQRWLGNKGGGSEQGPAMDRQARFNQFQRLYCNPGDNNGRMAQLCGENPVSVPGRFNKDIDFTRTVAAKHTLDLDFTDGKVTSDEEDVSALASNLYGHDVFNVLRTFPMLRGSVDADHEMAYLDLRQLVALRSVAQNTFNAQVALRARGDPGSGQFLRNALREMGMSDAEAKQYLDAGTNAPSYDAQMEILTRKLYQNPNFYVNLVDKPANVERQVAAMRALDLMQNRDIAQTLKRQEMLMSLIVELEVRTEQDRVQGMLDGRVSPRGE
jgi:hypothetical protein